MSAAGATGGVILIRNGRVYDHAGDVDLPPVADVLIIDGVVAALRAGIGRAVDAGEAVAELGPRAIDQTIDATEKLLLPGFVNAHYHSHDVLLKGCFETIPLEFWLLNALPPAYPKRSTAEIRARTLLGALECLRSGMTMTVIVDGRTAIAVVIAFVPWIVYLAPYVFGVYTPPFPNP